MPQESRAGAGTAVGSTSRSKRRRSASAEPAACPVAGDSATSGARLASAAGTERLDYILEMTRQLKLLARSDGLSHLALILEMAELEAGDAVQRRSRQARR